MSIQPSHIVDLVLGITFVMPRFTYEHLYEWTESNRYIFAFLPTCTKSTSCISLFLRYNGLIVLNYFGHA